MSDERLRVRWDEPPSGPAEVITIYSGPHRWDRALRKPVDGLTDDVVELLALVKGANVTNQLKLLAVRLGNDLEELNRVFNDLREGVFE